MKAALLPAVLLALAAPLPAVPAGLYTGTAHPPPPSAIDTVVLARLEKLGITPAEVCSDAVFVRRVFLDVIGTLPTAPEARAFLQDRNPAKRRELIDRLLARDEFADYWANKWSDLLRVKAEFPINLWPNAAQAYHRWIHTAVRENMPLDRFARELLTANGSNFRVGQVNFYRAVQNRSPSGYAQAVALAFMGTRADRWPAGELDRMAVFFSQMGSKATGEWKEEIVFFDPSKAPAGAGLKVVFPGGGKGTIAAGQDPREVFAAWLTDGSNPWFARAAANRTWAWLLGRGVVHEPDDFRPDNPPSHPELLALLERELVAARFDLKHLFRFILNSRTYQLASVPRSEGPEAAAQFASYPVRRLDAEVLIDALNQITGTHENYTSAIPEPFTFIPADQRSISLPDGSIGSPFLEMFGRPSRDTGLESERNNQPTATQRLHLLNSTHIRRKLEQGPKLQALLRAEGGPREVVSRLYLTILSRPPSEEEIRIALGYASAGAVTPREAAIDLAWALVNTAEFLHRH